MIFRDRKHAGQLLAEKLQKYKSENTIVVALPRGGVPVATEIAKALDAPLDVLIARKVSAPFQSEVAVGAICELEKPVWNSSMISRMGLTPDDLKDAVLLQQKKIKEQTKKFRSERPFPDVTNKRVILVDDGLATGATLFAGVKYLQKKNTAELIVAVPVAASSSASKLKNKVGEAVILEDRDDFVSVGQWYENFGQVSDEEVVTLLKQNAYSGRPLSIETEFAVGNRHIKGDVTVFPGMKSLIVFAHGSGSSRKSARNRQVASFLNQRGFGTVLLDLLTELEASDRNNVFNIELLSDRLAEVVLHFKNSPDLGLYPVGLFGASTGASAAIRAAGHLPVSSVYAIVSRGGRPDLAGSALDNVKAPTLLIVGGHDFGVIELNEQAQERLAFSKVFLIPGATHLFEEKGALEEVAELAAEWFREHLPDKKKNSVSRQNQIHKED